jgi:MFS family permease
MRSPGPSEAESQGTGTPITLPVATEPPATGFASVFAIRGARRLIWGAVIGRIPQGMLGLAGLLLVQEKYGNFALAGVVSAAFSIGLALAAPFQGRLLDRHHPRRVLRPLAAGQALIATAFAACASGHAPAAVVALLGLAAGALTPPLSATLRLTWMTVVDAGPVRDAAFALDAMTTQLLFALAPLLTALGVSLAGPAATVVLAGLIVVTGTLIFAGSSALRDRAHPDGDVTARTRPPGARRTVLLESAGLRLVLAAIVLVGWATGSMEVGLAAFAVHKGVPAVSGVLVGAWCIGGVIGGWVNGRRVWSASVDTRHRASAAAGALMTLPLLLANSIPAAIALAVFAGLPMATLFAAQYHMVGDRAPAHGVAEAFTWSVAAIVTGTSVGSAVGGVLASSIGPSACFVQAAVVLLVVLGCDQLIRIRTPA